MGASLSLAAFTALVAAITVVAAMTVLAAVGLLYYSAVKQDEAGEPFDTLAPTFDASELGLTVRDGPLALHELIDARKLVGFFDEEESSLSNFDPARSGQFDAAYGTPEWTEEEGATEIFSANNADEAEAAFADLDDHPTALASGRTSG